MVTIEPPSNSPKRDTSTRTKKKTRVELDSEIEQTRIHPAITVPLSTVFLLLSGYLAFGLGIASIPQAIFFAATCSIGLGGLSTLLGGTATITIGKWFRASGYIAVFVAVLILVMQAIGIVDILPGKKRTLLEFESRPYAANAVL